MHKLVKSALLILGASTLGSSLGISESRAAVDPLQEERECREALEAGTIDALEDFLRRYPDGNSACYALAYNALGQFSPNGRPSDSSGEGGGGRYGG